MPFFDYIFLTSIYYNIVIHITKIYTDTYSKLL